MLVLVGSGQSNMEASRAGRGGDRSTEPGVWCWEQFPKANLGQTKGWKQAGPDDPDFPWNNESNDPNGGVLYARARHLRKTTGQQLYIIRQAHGGQPIREFIPGGSVWPSLMVSLRDASASLQMAGRSPLADEYHFFQGEADADYRGATGPQWLAGLDAHFAQMRKKQAAYSNVQVCGPSTPVFLYELLHGGTTQGGLPTDDRNAEIKLFSDSRDPYVINVPSAGVGTTDNIHVDAVGLAELGGPRAAARAAMLPKVCRFSELGDGVVFIDGGYVTVNADTVVSIPLPVRLKTSYVPVLTLVASGTDSTFMPKAINRAPGSFQVNNPTGHNMVVGWTVTGRRA